MTRKGRSESSLGELTRPRNDRLDLLNLDRQTLTSVPPYLDPWVWGPPSASFGRVDPSCDVMLAQLGISTGFLG